MIIVDCEQGSEEWFEARRGIPTASNFSKIITSTGKPSTSANGYMNKLLAEWLMNKPLDSFKSEWMDRGNELEPEARNSYEFDRDIDVQKVGLVYKDDRKLISASPDGIIGENGGLEIKCPSPGIHVEYLLANKIPSIYFPQVMGNLWVCEREWWDFYSHNPDMEPLIIRVERDEKYIKSLEGAVEKFVYQMLGKREKLQSKKESK